MIVLTSFFFYYFCCFFSLSLFFSFFFNDTPPTEIYTLSLHDALPICARFAGGHAARRGRRGRPTVRPAARRRARSQDRKSTRLNSSHVSISYAVFCLKKKKKKKIKPFNINNRHAEHDKCERYHMFLLE